MRNFLVLTAACVSLLIWFFWTQSKAPPVQKTSFLSQKLARSRHPASLPAKQSKSSLSSEHPTPEIEVIAPDAEALGHDCLATLAESAASAELEFRKKVTDDSAAPVGLWFYDKSEKINPAKNPSAPDFFLRGLAMANLLDGRDNSKLNLKLALGLLLKAHHADPKNAAPLLYAAYVHKQLGNNEEALELLEQIRLEDMKYETYEIDAVHQIYKHVKTANDLLNSYELRSGMPIVNNHLMKNFLIENERQDVGYLMIQNQLNAETRQHSEPDGDLLVYAIGRSLIKDVSQVEYEKLPPAREALEKIKDHPQHKLVDLIELGKDCSLEKLQPLVEYFQSNPLIH